MTVSIDRRAVLGLLGAATVPAVSWSQADYPNRPIRLIMPWPAGGGADAIARMVAPHMSRRLGQQVVIDNKPGAAGTLAHTLAARAAPDGYTLLFSTMDTHALSSRLLKQVQFDPVKDFVAIGSCGSFPTGLVVHPSVPARNLAELVQWHKAGNKPFAFASSGAGTASHVLGELFGRMAGLETLHVPFQGAAPMVQATVGGQVLVGLNNVISLDQQVRGGNLRMLAVAMPKRLPPYPEVPTFEEQGFQIAGASWAGVVAPVGVPEPVIAKLHAAVAGAMAEPAVVESLQKLTAVLVPMTQQEFQAYLQAEYRRWGDYLRESKVTVEGS